MKNLIVISVISALLIIAFFVSFNWANGIDYSPIHQSMMPLGITWLIGVLALSSVGGIIGAIYDYNEEN